MLFGPPGSPPVFELSTRFSRLEALIAEGSLDDDLRWSYTHEPA